MSMSNWLEVEIRKHVFRTGSFTKPTVLAVSLHTADPTDVTATAAANEIPHAFGYERVQRDPGDANWSGASATDGLTDNVAAVTFPAPVGGNWGIATHAAVWDSATYGAGNLILHGALAAPKTINDGDPAPSFPAGALDAVFG